MDDEPTPQLAIAEATLDPAWHLGAVRIDGAELLVLSIDHPRHGTLYALVSRKSAADMRDVLIRMLGPADKPN